MQHRNTRSRRLQSKDASKNVAVSKQRKNSARAKQTGRMRSRLSTRDDRNTEVSEVESGKATDAGGGQASSASSERQDLCDPIAARPEHMATTAVSSYVNRPLEEPTWEVLKIVASVRSHGKILYRVRWEDTWEPIESLRGCGDDAMAEFHSSSPHAPSPYDV
ncbi:hypothetical protein M409DRAFT_61224 [Zasmidium cellare ATCC 36951]|uniref:Chromo domain-containing protein n=1 Tax=Zasmidium cellare ATCC 36951 TaxID=1080233 RepID=A0A6A6BVU5_ZASCE|nr:uncharacterized protein M409DRAFT_61224 [Zasmidium cellare ATCC 36951]KAF2158954.1 hypothetical protein M409DRAFT_61224 [Zasmidium cellare ATCC 36951]